jgi:hypothetical protein
MKSVLCNNVQRIQILSHLFSFFVDEKPLISCNLCSPWEISKFLPNELKIHIQQPGAYLKPPDHTTRSHHRKSFITQ